MSIYNKIKELSITLVLLVSLAFSILLPQIAQARKADMFNIFTFNFSETANSLPLVAVEDDVSSVNLIIINKSAVKNNNIAKAEQEERKKIAMLPFMFPVEQVQPAEPVIEKNNQIQLVLTEADTFPTNDEIAKQICEEAGISDLPCWQDLKAMRLKESYDGKEMTGDGGRSRGWYHIQIKMHGISDACALDFKCSTDWTVKNLIAHNYLTNRVYAISKHNGSGKMAQAYAKNVVYNSAKFE